MRVKPADPVLLQMAASAVDIALQGNLKRGLALALSAHARARNAGDARAELAALNAASRCHSMNNNALASMTSAMDALALAKRCEDAREHAHALCSIGSGAFALRLLDEALPIVLHAIEEARALADADLEARARQIQGENLGDLGRFDEARAELVAAREAARRTGREGFELRLSARLATLAAKRAAWHAARGESRTAVEAFRDAAAQADVLRVAAEAAANATLVLSMTAVIAAAREAEGALGEAREHYGGIIQRAVKAGYLAAVAPWSLRLAAIEERLGEHDAARSTLEAALRVAEGLRPTFRVAELVGALAALAESQGQSREALRWRERQAEEQFLFAREQARARAVLAAQDWKHGLSQ